MRLCPEVLGYDLLEESPANILNLAHGRTPASFSFDKPLFGNFISDLKQVGNILRHHILESFIVVGILRFLPRHVKRYGTPFP